MTMSESWFNTSHDNMATQSLMPEAFDRFKYDMLNSRKKWSNDPTVYRIVTQRNLNVSGIRGPCATLMLRPRIAHGIQNQGRGYSEHD